MTRFMKKERFLKISQYIAMGLLWLVALIGVSAYAIYWCKQCANQDEPQQAERYLPKRNAIDYDKEVIFSFYDDSHYNTDAYSTGLNDLIHPSTVQAVVYSLDLYTTGQYNLGTYNGTDFVGNYFHIDFDYLTGDEVEGWYVRNLRIMPIYSTFFGLDAESSLSQDTWVYWWNAVIENMQPYSYTGQLYIDNIRNGNNEVISADYLDPYDLFNYIFNIDINLQNSVMFEYDSNFNFSRMASEVVTSERLLVPFNNQFNGDPTDEFIQFYYKVDFKSNGEIYHGVWLKLNKPIYIYKDSLMQVNFVGSLSQLQVVQVLYMKNLPSSLGDNGEMWADNSDNYTIVANKHIIRYESYDDGQTERQVAVYDYKQYDWVNQSYRVCYFDLSQYNDAYQCYRYPNDNTMFNSRLYQGLTLYQVLNNGFSDYNYITNVYTDNGTNLNLVFDLYRGAFSGLSALMSISVIPGVTLGLLFFAPFLVTAIIVIVRLVRG